MANEPASRNGEEELLRREEHAGNCPVLRWRAASALKAAQPEGWVLMPREPTEEMMRAWVVNYDSATALGLSWRECRIQAYCAMLSAAASAGSTESARQERSE